MPRLAFVMYVHAGFELEYERRHNPIWSDLERTLLDHGVKTYSIFLHPSTRQLFAYAEVEDEARWRAIAGTETCQKWWSYMSGLMVTNSDGSPQAQPLREVFHLGS